MVRVEVVSELGVIDELTGEQALDALATPLRGAAGPVLRLAGVLGADGGEQPIAERRLHAEQTTQGRVRHLGPLRLFDEEVPEEGVAGEVAAQDGVEGNAVARIQTGLRDQDRWNGRGAALADLEHGEPIVDGGGEGGLQTLDVGGVGDVVGIGDRVDARRDRRFKLGQPLAQSGGQLGPTPVEGSARPPALRIVCPKSAPHYAPGAAAYRRALRNLNARGPDVDRDGDIASCRHDFNFGKQLP